MPKRVGSYEEPNLYTDRHLHDRRSSVRFSSRADWVKFAQERPGKNCPVAGLRPILGCAVEDPGRQYVQELEVLSHAAEA